MLARSTTVMRWIGLLVGLSGSPSCRPAGDGRSEPQASEPEGPAAEATAGGRVGPQALESEGPSATEATVGPLAVVVDGRPPRPVGEALAMLGADASHVEVAGWSSDGEMFAWCQTIDGCRECRFVGRDGAMTTAGAGDGCDGAGPEGELDARLAALWSPTVEATWAAGDRLVLVVETRETETTNDGSPRPLLKLGARSVDEPLPQWLVFVDPCEGCGLDQECTTRAHVDALAPSPDGQQVAALIHLSGAGGRDELRLERIGVARLLEAVRAPASRAR